MGKRGTTMVFRGKAAGLVLEALSRPRPREMVAADIYPVHKRVWTGPGELERTGYIDPPASPSAAEVKP